MENTARDSSEHYTQHNMDVGDLLRKTREGYGKSLSDVERILRIRECQLAAIELGDVSKLPGRVYTIGFVRTYAEYLGLDGGELVKLYRAQYMDAQPKQIIELAIPASDTKIPSFGIAVFLTLLLFAGGYYWMNINKANRSIVVDIPSPRETEIGTQVPAVSPDTASVTENPAPIDNTENTEGAVAQEARPVEVNSQVPAEGDKVTGVVSTAAEAKKGVTLTMIENSWVEIKDDKGKVIVSDVLKTGDQYFVPDNPGLTMSLGNAGGVEIVLDGRVMKPLGKTGDIRRDIPLNTDYLKTLEFKDEQPPKETAPAVPAVTKTDKKVKKVEPN